MNLERLNEPINSQSVEEHEKMLTNKMNEIRLQYVDRIFSKKIPPLEEKIDIDGVIKRELPVDDFYFILDRYTSIIRDLVGCRITQKKNEGIEWKPEMYDSVESEFRNKIIELHEKNPDHWIEKTLEIFENEQKKAENIFINPNTQANEIETEEMNDRHGTAGLVHFDIDGGYSYWFKGSDIPSPVNDSDVCMSIHMEPLFKKTLSNPDTNVFSSKSLEKLAIQIVEKFPETKAILGESWLMDTPIAKRIGFKVYKRENYSGHGGFWQQFVNSNGQIDKARVKKFLETGKAPYGIALGAMMTEDFLKKYLPKEHRGKITLKEVNSNFDENRYKDGVEMFKEFGEKWDTLDEKGVEEFLLSVPFLEEFNETEPGEGFIDFLKKLKKEKKTREEIPREPKILYYRKAYEEFIKSIRFINKEVIIE